ncbi:hypothetical protein ACWD4O_38950 [Streptomyces sp. NPDC002623]
MSTAEEEPIGSRQFAGAQRDVERLLQENVTSWSIVNAVWQRFRAAQGRDAVRQAFRRGYERGRENATKSTAEQMQQLQATVAELRQDRDPEGLRARIADLQYVAHGYGRMHTGGSDLRADLADALKRLQAAQRELAELKGWQPSNATGERPS